VSSPPSPHKSSFAHREGDAYVLRPIGVVRSPFREKVEAPRQPAAARGVEGSIQLASGHNFEHALEDLAGWEHLWVVFVFDRNEGWRPKVLPPRSEGGRVGVFATRSPHRPNPIGLSVVRLLAVEGLTLRVADLDILDGTPVLDIKPYVAYTDAIPSSRNGWLDAATEDPKPAYEVTWSPAAREQAEFVLAEAAFDLVAPVTQALALGPTPHPYRRIRAEGPGFRLAFKEWRVRFTLRGHEVKVLQVSSGYRSKDLAGDAPGLAVHRAFVERFGAAKAPW
jgi:tRNA-Thr(GGU) m(6)t(6)A37 methyltransferase TsaA